MTHNEESEQSEQMEKISLDISKKETVGGFLVWYDQGHERFKENDAVKNVCDGVTRALEFVQNDVFIFTFLIDIFSKHVLNISFEETISY